MLQTSMSLIVAARVESPMEAPEFVRLYRLAFDQYRAHALWNIRKFDAPTEGDALVVARALRVEGDMAARFFG